MSIVLLLGVVCVLIGGALVLRDAVVDPFQAAGSLQPYVRPEVARVVRTQPAFDRRVYTIQPRAMPTQPITNQRVKLIRIQQIAGRTAEPLQIASMQIFRLGDNYDFLNSNEVRFSGYNYTDLDRNKGSEHAFCEWSGQRTYSRGGEWKAPGCGAWCCSPTGRVRVRASQSNNNDDGIWHLYTGTKGVKNHPNIYHSRDGNAVLEVEFVEPQHIDRIVIFNRGDCCQSRLQNYECVIRDANGASILTRALTFANEQTIQMPNSTCPAGFRLLDGRQRDTTCYQSCDANDDTLDGGVRCIKRVCERSDEVYSVESGQRICRQQCPSTHILGGEKCVQRCATNEITLPGNTQCREACPAGRVQTELTCITPCPSTHRYIETNEKRCFPNNVSSYRTIRWEGHLKPYAGDGTWCVRNNGDGQFADVVASPGACHSGDNQHGSYLYGTSDGEIISGFTRMCLDANNSEKLVWWPCHGGNNQKWTLTNKNQIESVAHPARCVTLTGMTPSGASATIAANSLLRLEPCDCLAANQIFNIPGRTVQPFTNPPASATARMTDPVTASHQQPANASEEEDGTEAFA